jgi:hypothetical protein
MSGLRKPIAIQAAISFNKAGSNYLMSASSPASEEKANIGEGSDFGN